MITRQSYAPAAAYGAKVRKEGETWTLILTRDLRHTPELVWSALTDPAELREWAPFEADRNLAAVGPVALSTVGAPVARTPQSTVTRVDPPRLLEYSWGENAMRWELEPAGGGTRLTLWHSIGRKWVAMGAAGWHICLDVLGFMLDGHPIGRIVGGEAVSFNWKSLNAEYSKLFGVEEMNPPSAK
ncbi:MAG TPA: SRPBCC family protein [Gemmatimonadaceae bacterium]|nr:SRPBCC family protein [Gemmatimonadaceae bacterium]